MFHEAACVLALAAGPAPRIEWIRAARPCRHLVSRWKARAVGTAPG